MPNANPRIVLKTRVGRRVYTCDGTEKCNNPDTHLTGCPVLIREWDAYNKHPGNYATPPMAGV